MLTAQTDCTSSAPLLGGLARNPAAPVDVLLRLLQTWPKPASTWLRHRRELPPQVQDVMSQHPLWQVRAALAEHRQVDPEVRAGLLGDPQWQVRLRALGRAGQRPLSDDVLTRLLAELNEPPADMPASRAELFDFLAEGMRYDRRLFRLAAAHPEPGVRQYASFLAWSNEPALQDLLTDPVPEVRAAATEAVAEQHRLRQPADLPDRHCHGFWDVLQRPLSRALVDQVLASGDVDALHFVATNPTTPPDVVETLLGHPAAEVRQRIATRPDLTVGQLLCLAGDPAVEVRTAVSTHAGLTEQQRAVIAIDVTTARGDGCYGPCDGCRCASHYGATEPVPDLVDALRWSRSVNPLLRRRAARHPELPADVVGALADDADLGVRVLLAQHPDAPADLLLRCFLEYHGCGRRRLSTLPRFPTTGLSRFAGHADPAVRRLVALDPGVDPQLVHRLCADPDTAVRRAMASCPRLPADRIIALLDNAELAEHAAANPALPLAQMQRILQHCSR